MKLLVIYGFTCSKKRSFIKKKTKTKSYITTGTQLSSTIVYNRSQEFLNIFKNSKIYNLNKFTIKEKNGSD